MALGAGQAQCPQQVRQAELVGRPQGGLLDADGAGPCQLERIHVDALEIGLGGVRTRRGIGQREVFPQQRSAMRWASASTAESVSIGSRSGWESRICSTRLQSVRQWSR